MKRYPQTFLQALAAWQNGWGEDPLRRRKVILTLQEALAHARMIPLEAFQVSEVCYRKRFLVPHNPQNGGDLLPLFWDGSITEGVASWSTDIKYVTVSFKKGQRPGAIATLFATTPSQEDVVLNIKALWNDNEFREAVHEYQSSADPLAKALLNFGAKQSEVLLKSTLRVDEIKGFCGAVPSLEEVCQVAGISDADEEDAIWQKMVDLDYLPTKDFWIFDDAANRAINAVAQRFHERLKERLAAGLARSQAG